MARHTTMPPRIQKTPHGDVTLTSKWAHDRYYLAAYGAGQAVHWLFPNLPDSAFERIGGKVRHSFAPSLAPITVERDLRRICGAWQTKWDERLQNEANDIGNIPPTSACIETLKQAFEHHQAHYATLLGDRTSQQYPARMQEWFDYLGADTRLEDITAEVILSARAKMQKDRKSSNTTINGKVSTLKKILNMAHRKGWVSKAPWRDVPPLRSIQDQVRYWNADQVAVAFTVAREDEHASGAMLMLTLGIHLGLRKNEAVNLRWMDLDLDRPHPRTGQPSPIARIQQRPGFTTKTYENRKIPISAECKQFLLANRPVDAKPEDFILDAERHHQKRGGTKRVYRYDPVKLWRRVLEGAIAMGNPRIEFKEMRHSFACNCLQIGHSVERVARWLGHKDPRMVRQHYAFLLDYDDDTGLKFLEEE